jgi:RNA polymerase sigma factor (sigma-70 family)
MSDTSDFEIWPVDLPKLIEDPQFAIRVTAAAKRKMANITEEEVFDGISSFVIRALEEEAKTSDLGIGTNRSFLTRFPSSYSVIRYIVVTIRNRRIRKGACREETNAATELDSADVDQAQTDTLENLIVSYLAFLNSTDATDLSRDPAGLDLLEQQVIVGRWKGRSQSEIGSQIGKSVSTVHRIEKQAHEKLRKWLLD